MFAVTKWGGRLRFPATIVTLLSLTLRNLDTRTSASISCLATLRAYTVCLVTCESWPADNNRERPWFVWVEVQCLLENSAPYHGTLNVQYRLEDNRLEVLKALQMAVMIKDFSVFILRVAWEAILQAPLRRQSVLDVCLGFSLA